MKLTSQQHYENAEQLLKEITEDPETVIINSGLGASEIEFLRIALTAALIGMKPIPMLLYCPRCAMQHVDKIEPEKNWANPPHKSHLCGGCGHIWRPSDIATTGVEKIETKGQADLSAVPSHIAPKEPK